MGYMKEDVLEEAAEVVVEEVVEVEADEEPE